MFVGLNFNKDFNIQSFTDVKGDIYMRIIDKKGFWKKWKLIYSEK